MELVGHRLFPEKIPVRSSPPCKKPHRRSQLLLAGFDKTTPFRQSLVEKVRISTRRQCCSSRCLVIRSNSSNNIDSDSSRSPARTVMKFYSAINEKDSKQLEKLLAEDCLFEDYTFPKPFHGKKETMNFLEQLMSCMGKNMKFNVVHVCEGRDFTAAVDWHLDWNKIKVPFTRGCSYYSLSLKSGEELVIRKAQVLIESPIKPGGVALNLFKVVASLFDAFPEAAEWFLKSPHLIFRFLRKVYNVVAKPVISPILVWYMKMLSFAAFVLRLCLKVAYYIAKIFSK